GHHSEGAREAERNRGSEGARRDRDHREIVCSETLRRGIGPCRKSRAARLRTVSTTGSPRLVQPASLDRALDRTARRRGSRSSGSTRPPRSSETTRAVSSGGRQSTEGGRFRRGRTPGQNGRKTTSPRRRLNETRASRAPREAGQQTFPHRPRYAPPRNTGRRGSSEAAEPFEPPCRPDGGNPQGRRPT